MEMRGNVSKGGVGYGGEWRGCGGILKPLFNRDGCMKGSVKTAYQFYLKNRGGVTLKHIGPLSNVYRQRDTVA